MENNNNKNMISGEIVRYVSGLSRIRLNAEDEDLFRVQLSSILGYIDQLKEVDTADIAPTSHVLPSMKNVFREDEPVKSLPREKALSNAPSEKDGFFRVPRIINEA